MRLGLVHGSGAADFAVDMEMVLEAESLGYHSVWTSESYGADAVTPAAWMLARTTKINVGTGIMQMPTRTPTMAAMTANTLQAMSGGRFILGLGASGPQVIEGWHGVPYGRPLTRTREYIAIVRQILERKGPATHEGFHYSLPNKGEGTTGLGIPLKSILHGDPSLKIYTASITPKGVSTAAEVADGFLPIYMNPDRYDVFEAAIDEGLAKAGNGKSLKDFDVAPYVNIIMGDDLDACRAPIKAQLALYVGGMGARNKNFYNDLAKRMGYEDAAVQVQDFFLDGKKAEAAAAIPDALVDEVALVGPADRIRERLGAWKAAGAEGKVGSLLLRKPSVEALRLVAEEVL
jgi:F420-dependent oxidoreductase-like protein